MGGDGDEEIAFAGAIVDGEFAVTGLESVDIETGGGGVTGGVAVDGDFEDRDGGMDACLAADIEDEDSESVTGGKRTDDDGLTAGLGIEFELGLAGGGGHFDGVFADGDAIEDELTVLEIAVGSAIEGDFAGGEIGIEANGEGEGGEGDIDVGGGVGGDLEFRRAGFIAGEDGLNFIKAWGEFDIAIGGAFYFAVDADGGTGGGGFEGDLRVIGDGCLLFRLAGGADGVDAGGSDEEAEDTADGGGAFPVKSSG